MFPKNISIVTPGVGRDEKNFNRVWEKLVEEECHKNTIWTSLFANALKSPDTDLHLKYQLAAVWATNMVVGSYCFPRYVAALASRAQQDIVRHGLLENAWDESGGPHHTSRSHFWLAVRLVRLLGLDDQEIENITPLPAAQLYTNQHFEICANGDFEVGLGMICLIEEFTTPEFTMIFRAFLASCKECRGIDPQEFVLGGGAEYFTANIADDERHREEMPKLVAYYLQQKDVDLNQQDQISKALEGVREGMRLSISLRHEFFEGIYKYVKSGHHFKQLSGLS